MYTRDKAKVVLLFLLITCLAFWLSVDFKSIADSAIAVVSIALAVYIGAASVLLGSPFAQRLKEHRDEQIRTKTSLGVLAGYLRVAGKIGLGTIIVSALFAVKLEGQPIINCLGAIGLNVEVVPLVIRVLEAIACGMFAANLFFIWRILIFLINSLTKSV